MAKLVGVSSSPSPCLSRRQLPLTIEPGLTMIMALEDRCLACGKPSREDSGAVTAADNAEHAAFLKRLLCLSGKERAKALMVSVQEVQSCATQCVSCVGCRRSIEQLLTSLLADKKGSKGGDDAALQPLRLIKSGHVSVDEEHIQLPEALSRLFTLALRHLESTCAEYAPKGCRRSAATRCSSHSLSSSSRLGMEMDEWIDVWESMEPECQAEVALLPFSLLKMTVDKYLRRHSFCTECTAMVNKAFNMLIDMEEGDENEDDNRERCSGLNKNCMEFRKSLFKGLNPCKREQHLHVSCDESLLSRLMALADPDVGGLKQERHAKTMELAQKEILICIGITMYERLARIKHKLREAQQTFDLLFMVVLTSLKRSCQVACDQKTGLDDVDRICDELDRDDKEKKAREGKKKEVKKANGASNAKKKKGSTNEVESANSNSNSDSLKNKTEKKKLTTSKQNKTCNKQNSKQNKQQQDQQQKQPQKQQKSRESTPKAVPKVVEESDDSSKKSSISSSFEDDLQLGDHLSLLQISDVLEECMDSSSIDCCLPPEVNIDNNMFIVCSESMRKQRENLRLKLKQGFDALCQDVSTGRRPFILRA